MAKKKNPTREELIAENSLLKRQRNVHPIASVLNNLVRWGGLVLISYFIYLSVDALSGQKTVADIGVRFFGEISISTAVAWIFGIGGAGYGLRQRSLRRETTEKLQGRIKHLEKHYDPGRSSSGLTERGETHPKDQL